MDISLHMVLVALILLLVLILLNDTENFRGGLSQEEISQIVRGTSTINDINAEWQKEWADPIRNDLNPIKIPLRWTRASTSLESRKAEAARLSATH